MTQHNSNQNLDSRDLCTFYVEYNAREQPRVPFEPFEEVRRTTDTVLTAKRLTEVEDGFFLGTVYPKKPVDDLQRDGYTYGKFLAFKPEGDALTVFNDALGLMNCFMYREEGLVILSDNIEPILHRLNKLDKTVTKNPVFVEAKQRGLAPPGTHTAYEEIQALPPNTEFDLVKDVSSRQWYSFDYSASRTADELKTVFKEIFPEVCQEYARRNTAFALSGGLDSRFVYGFIGENTYTFHHKKNTVDETSAIDSYNGDIDVDLLEPPSNRVEGLEKAFRRRNGNPTVSERFRNRENLESFDYILTGGCAALFNGVFYERFV